MGLSTWFFVPYFLAYSLSLLLCCCYSAIGFSPLLAFLSLAGLPPFPLFMVKVLVLIFVPSITSFILLTASALSLYPYTVVGLSTLSSASTSLTNIFSLIGGSSLLLLVCFP